MNASTTQIWLKTASAIVVGFGVVIALSAHPAFDAITLFMADMAFWPIDGTQSLSTPETRLLCAVSGGMMMGWGVLFWLIATRLYPSNPGLARTMILSSIGVWFVVDSVGSLIVGAPLNVLFNVGFLLAFVWPLWRDTKHGEA